MTPLEYVEVCAVEIARYRAQQSYRALYVKHDTGYQNWRRYCWAFLDELDRQGIHDRVSE